MFTPFHAVISTFGYRLNESDGFDAAAVDAAVAASHAVVPKFLCLFYRHAARNKPFAQAFNRFLPPNEWDATQDHLTFLVNDETNERWGILLGTECYEQPPVERIDDQGIWQLVSDNLPFFLTFMLHFNAVNGGFELRGKTDDFTMTDASLDGWTFGGSVSVFTAYSRRNQAICFRDTRLYAGAKTDKDLRKLERDLNVSLQI